MDDILSYTTNNYNNPVDGASGRKILKFASTKKDSILLQKIKERSKRKKRLAPKPLAKEQTCTSSNGRNSVENEKTDSKRQRKTSFLEMSTHGNKSGDSQIPCERNDIMIRNSRSEKSQSAIERSRSSSKQDYDRNDKYVNEKNVLKPVNEEQENKMRGGYKGIFPKSHYAEDKDKANDRIYGQVNKFNR